MGKISGKNFKLWDGKKKISPKRKQGRRRTELTRTELTLFEEFLLTLIWIRRGYDTYQLAFLFGTAQSHVCRLFTTWVIFISKCFKGLIVWPSKELVRGNLPSSFRKFPRSRRIIDCSEIFVEKPLRPTA